MISYHFEKIFCYFFRTFRLLLGSVFVVWNAVIRILHPVEIASFVSGIEGVLSVHDVRLWSLDGEKHCATMCVVVDSVGCRDFMQIKYDIREKLLAYGVVYMAVEMDG